MNTYLQHYKVNYIDNEFLEVLSNNSITLSMLAVEYYDSNDTIQRDIVIKETHDLLHRTLIISIQQQVKLNNTWHNIDKPITKIANDKIYVNKETGAIANRTDALTITIDDTTAKPISTLNEQYCTEFDFYIDLFGQDGSSHYDLHAQLIANLRGITYS